MIDSLKDLGTAIFYQPLFNILFGLVAILPGHSLGWAIVGLTVLIRLLLLPSSAAAVKSQRETMALQPKIDEIRTKYKDKPEEMNQRLVAVYQEHKVNPFGSCLPLLIQLPILIVLYQVFLNGIHADNFDLLYSFVPVPTDVQTHLFGIDLLQPSILLALVTGGLQFWQTWQLMNKRQQLKDEKKLPKDEQPKPTDAAKTAEQLGNRMLYIMPVITTVFAATLPAALSVYWTVTTLFSIAQQAYLIRTQPALPHEHVQVTVRNKKK